MPPYIRPLVIYLPKSKIIPISVTEKKETAKFTFRVLTHAYFISCNVCGKVSGAITDTKLFKQLLTPNPNIKIKHKCRYNDLTWKIIIEEASPEVNRVIIRAGQK